MTRYRLSTLPSLESRKEQFFRKLGSLMILRWIQGGVLRCLFCLFISTYRCYIMYRFILLHEHDPTYYFLISVARLSQTCLIS
ncbi:hypothetical protein Hanom_Chr12g01078161 [Helianthus anomalus]